MAAQAKEEEEGRSWPERRRRDEAGQNRVGERWASGPTCRRRVVVGTRVRVFCWTRMVGKKEL
jgi:hypothetical protein